MEHGKGQIAAMPRRKKPRSRKKYHKATAIISKAEEISFSKKIFNFVRDNKAKLTFITGIPSAIIGVSTIISQSTVEIEPSGPTYNPFLIPFVVKNPSHIFQAKEIDLTCVADKIYVGGAVITNVSMKVEQKFNADRGESKFVYCRLLSASLDMKARIHFEGTYKNWFFERKIPEKIISWDSNSSPPRWIRADSSF